MNIWQTISGVVADICYTFSADAYQYAAKERKRKFPSLISAIVRFVIRHWYIFLPLLWLGVFIACILEKLEAIAILVVSIVATLLVAAMLALGFAALMAIESLAKHLASLILYDQMDDLPENPVDATISFILKGKL